MEKFKKYHYESPRHNLNIEIHQTNYHLNNENPVHSPQKKKKSVSNQESFDYHKKKQYLIDDIKESLFNYRIQFGHNSIDNRMNMPKKRNLNSTKKIQNLNY